MESAAGLGRSTPFDGSGKIEDETTFLTRIEPDRELLRDAVVDQVSQGGNALISGPTGIGKTTLLRSVAARLRESSTQSSDVLLLKGEDAASRLEVVDASAILLIDGIQDAPALLETVTQHVAQGGQCVATFTASAAHAPFPTAILERLRSAGPAQLPPLQALLEPLSPAHMERLIHKRSGSRVDVATVNAVIELAHGRPAWAADLLTLAEAGYLVTGPYPAVMNVPLNQQPLPALQSARSLLRDLSPTAAAASVALAEIDPLDEVGIAALVGPEITGQLLHVGALIPCASSTALTVPSFLATAARDLTSRAEIEKFRVQVAERLLAQEALGIPLSERETMYCTSMLEHSVSRDQNDPLADSKRSVLLRALSTHLTFGDTIHSRGLLLKLALLAARPDKITRARTMAVFGESDNAAAVLQQVVQEADPQTHTAAQFLRAVLMSEREVESLANATAAHGIDDSVPLDAAEDDIVFVIHLWNSVVSIASHVRRLRTISNQHEDPLVAGLARALLDLDAVWRGRQPAASSWVRGGSPMSIPAAVSAVERDLASTILAAQGLTALLTSQGGPRREELLAATAAFPAPKYHQRWIHHLIAASLAITFGDTERAMLEWDHLEATLPRFLPLRMRNYVQTTGEAFRAAADSELDGSVPDELQFSLPYRMGLYFAGRHRALLQARPDSLATNEVLPLIRLANDHLDASEERNPIALLQVAERFRAAELWLPCAHALSDARAIFVSRRSSGKVLECDEKLTAVWEEVRRCALWFNEDQEVIDPPHPLTPRERDAAELAAKGLSNREIALRLGCKVRTVESHLSQARAKLGASSRLDIGKMLLRATK